MRRISVVGTTGSGKTTLGRALAAKLGVPFVELDALNWGESWTPVSDEVFQRRTREAIAGEAWVVDGNYGGRGIREIVFERADTVVWLNLSLPVMLWRLFARTQRRIRAKETLWSGNRETWSNTFLSRNSLFLWQLKVFRRHRRIYAELMSSREYAHLRWIRLRSPRDMDRFLESVPARS